jgi:hypothetical protein
MVVVSEVHAHSGLVVLLEAAQAGTSTSSSMTRWQPRPPPLPRRPPHQLMIGGGGGVAVGGSVAVAVDSAVTAAGWRRRGRHLSPWMMRRLGSERLGSSITPPTALALALTLGRSRRAPLMRWLLSLSGAVAARRRRHGRRRRADHRHPAGWLGLPYRRR